MYHYNPVYIAIEHNDYRKLEKLAKEGVDINAPIRGGWTPAHHAAGDGRIKCLEVIAKYTKTYINAPDDRGKTPTDFATGKGHPKCVEFLTKHKENNMTNSIELNKKIDEFNKRKKLMSFKERLTQEQLDKRIIEAQDRCKPLDVSNTDCSRLDFMHIDLNDALFVGTNCEKADFSSALLKKANFTKAKLRDANFSYTKCQKAKFVDADCQDVNYFKAKLRNADFTDANYEGADFTRAKVNKAKGLILVGGKYTIDSCKL